jgi:hypothetical protein
VPHPGVVQAGTGVNAPTTSAGAMSSDRVRIFLKRVRGFVGSSFLFPAEWILWNCGSGRGEEPSGGNVLRLIQIRLMRAVYTKTAPILSSKAWPSIPVGLYLTRKPPDSGSGNAVNFSSACTTKRFPSSRCASTIQIVRSSRGLLPKHSHNSIRLC